MKKSILMLWLIVMIGTGGPAAAQSVVPKREIRARQTEHMIDAAPSPPFALDTLAASEMIKIRSAREIDPEGRQAIARTWPILERKATEEGFDLSRNGWKLDQIVSSAFPEHLLLLFSLDRSPSELSEFSVILPLDGKAPLHIIPICRRGYFPYSAPQENPTTLAVFNQALASERAHQKPYWLSVSLCYAVLSGGHLVTPLPASANESNGGHTEPAATPSFRIAIDGSAVARFAMEDAEGKSALWELTFDKCGNLRKAAIFRNRSSNRLARSRKSPSR